MSFAAVPKIVLHEVPMQPYYAGAPLAESRHPVVYVIQTAFDLDSRPSSHCCLPSKESCYNFLRSKSTKSNQKTLWPWNKETNENVSQ